MNDDQAKEKAKQAECEDARTARQSIGNTAQEAKGDTQHDARKDFGDAKETLSDATKAAEAAN